MPKCHFLDHWAIMPGHACTKYSEAPHVLFYYSDETKDSQVGDLCVCALASTAPWLVSPRLPLLNPHAAGAGRGVP